MSDRIPAEQSAEFPAWTLPDVQQHDANGDLILHGSLTARELEEITNQAYDEGKQQGYDDGHAEGKKAGHQAGLEAAQPEIRHTVQRLMGVMESLMQPIAGQERALEQAMVELVVDISRAVVKRDLQLAPAAIEQLVRESVAALPRGATSITITLHPDDLALIQQNSTLPETWRLVADSALTPGGCSVTSDHSAVDFTLEHRLGEILDSLKEQHQAADAASAMDGGGDER